MRKVINIIDDNENLTRSLSIILRTYNFKVMVYNCPKKALEFQDINNPPDCYIIDIKMPKINGIELYEILCKKYSKKSLPALFLTGVEEFESKCLRETNILDFVRKPFNTEGLIARIERIINKNYDKFNKKLIKIGNLTLDENKMCCYWFKKNISLTKKEYKILSALTNRPKNIFSRGQLLEICYNNQLNVSDRVIDSQIKRIRQKFNQVHPETNKFNRIVTSYGTGYKWVPKNIC